MSNDNDVHATNGAPMPMPMKNHSMSTSALRAMQAIPAILTLGMFMAACEKPYEAPPTTATTPEFHDDKRVIQAAATLLKQAVATGTWTPQQDDQFFHELSGLSAKERFAQTLQLVNLINTRKVKRAVDPGDPAPPVECPTNPCPCQTPTPSPKAPSSKGSAAGQSQGAR
jgi:hypothetical protein